MIIKSIQRPLISVKIEDHIRQVSKDLNLLILVWAKDTSAGENNWFFLMIMTTLLNPKNQLISEKEEKHLKIYYLANKVIYSTVVVTLSMNQALQVKWVSRL